jgi:hypothetical protein
MLDAECCGDICMLESVISSIYAMRRLGLLPLASPAQGTTCSTKGISAALN